MDLVAFPIRGSNIAPIFDFSPWFLLVYSRSDGKTRSTKLHLQTLTATQKARALLEAGVKTVICGCISDSFQETLEKLGIRVIWGITGPFKKVLESFRAKRLDNSPYRVLKQEGKGRKPSGFHRWTP